MTLGQHHAWHLNAGESGGFEELVSLDYYELAKKGKSEVGDAGNLLFMDLLY